MSETPSVVTPSVTKAVLPAAGFGTRLRPLTHAFPKELLPIGRKPVLAHVATELRQAGITHALFIVSERKPQIRAFFGEVYVGEEEERNLPPLHCDYVTQTEQRGSGDAVLRTEAWVGAEPFVVAFGDCLIDAPASEPLHRLIETHRRVQSAATILVERVAWEKVSRYGVVAPQAPTPEPPTEPFALADIVEKPSREEAPSDLVVAARFVLNPTIFEALRRTPPDARGEQNLPDAMRLLRREGLPLWAVPLREGEARRDIGNFESYYAAFVRAALRDPEFAESAKRAALEEMK